MRFCRSIIIFLAIVFGGSCAQDYALAQDFPYLAPTAPEFDGHTPQVRGPTKAPAPQPEPQHQGIGPKISPVTPQIFQDFGLAPSTEDSQEKVVSSPPVRRRNTHNNNNYNNGQYHSPPQAPTNFGQGEPAVVGQRRPVPQTPQRQRVDCSQYPGMIANARSEAEMQMTARYYLTCLVQGGVPMENARAQVIATIEAAMRAGR